MGDFVQLMQQGVWRFAVEEQDVAEDAELGEGLATSLVRPEFEATEVALGSRGAGERHQGGQCAAVDTGNQPIFIEGAFLPLDLRGDIRHAGALLDFQGNDGTDDAGILADVPQAL